MKRRRTREVRVGSVGIGGNHPIRVQSMTTAAPQDVAGTVAECVRLAEAGCEITRISTPKVPDAAVLAEVKRELAQRGVTTPLVADIHFVPAAAMEAAKHADKVRINPGNFADHKTGKVIEFDEAEYAAEMARLEEKFLPLLESLRARGAALRIGSNHGSLSDRILCRYGDSPEGMVESAMEYLRLAAKNGFHDVILSMKSSNPRVMVEACRRLVAKMDREGMNYPLHLGVTEAGEGEDGRIKSAVGIGALLADGIGDTVRVSLAEPPEAEIPVARELAGFFRYDDAPEAPPPVELPPRRRAEIVGIVGGSNPVRIVGDYTAPSGFEIPCEVDVAAFPGMVTVEDAGEFRIPTEAKIVRLVIAEPAGGIHFIRRAAAAAGARPLILAYRHRQGCTAELAAAVALGPALIEGIGDAVEIIDDAAGSLGIPRRHNLAISLLQNSLTRISRVQIIACPSCGRTLFDLPSVTQEVKRRFAHLKGVKIAVMGCIVNGPGEMADADFGFVGGAVGRISLYRKFDCIERNIPTEEAYERLVELIKKEGMWVEPRDE